MAKVTFNNPVMVDPGATEFRLVSLMLDADCSMVVARFREIKDPPANDGKVIVVVWEGDEGKAILQSINKGNFTTVSLQQRAIERAIADGKIAQGTAASEPTD